MTQRIPKHIKDLSTYLDMTIQETLVHLDRAQQFFRKRDISFGYNTHLRVWIAGKLDKTDCSYTTLKMGILRAIEYMDAPTTLIKQFEKQC